jgi:hypothetical protein
VVLGLVDLLIVLAVIGCVAAVGYAGWTMVRSAMSPTSLPGRGERTLTAEAIKTARWTPAHDEVDGRTRILLRRSYTGLDGLPVVLEERVLTAFPADDPTWESNFAEEMANARVRCSFLNAEES